MKYNRLHTAVLIVSLAFIGLMVDSCKSKKQEIPPFIDVHLEVKDANNVPSTGATVYLYNTEEAFQTAYQKSLELNYNSTGSILTTTITDGKLDLKGLPSNTEYWILVHDTSDFFIDPNNPAIKILGYKVDKDNSEAYYKIDGFQNGTTVLANITLQPVSSLIKFVKAPGLVESINEFRLNDDLSSSPMPTNYTKRRKGTVGYQARTSSCVWTGEIEAVGGKAFDETLVKCDYRTVRFTNTNFTLQLGESIKIYVGQNRASIQPLAELTFGKNTETLILDNGNGYTYFAEFYTGLTRKCVYEGLIGAGNVTIPLAPCN